MATEMKPLRDLRKRFDRALLWMHPDNLALYERAIEHLEAALTADRVTKALAERGVREAMQPPKTSSDEAAWRQVPKVNTSHMNTPPEYWCNKCGYLGPNQTHDRPNGTGQCGYLGSPTKDERCGD